MSSTEDNPVMYEDHSFVRVRLPLTSWANWNHRLEDGPKLIVRKHDFEIAAPQGMMLDTRHLVIAANDATIWIDKVGWAGTRFGRKECIHVAGRDHKGRRVQLAISPRGGLQGAWQALLNSGVSPRDPA